MPPTSDQDKHPPRGRQAPTGLSGAPPLEVTLNAEWVAPSIVRGRVRDWLAAHQWPAAQVDELVLAVSEAVSNSIEHGYAIPSGSVASSGEMVDVHGEVVVHPDGFRQVVFTVRDKGRWRAPSGRRTTRGHGMLIMRTCTDDVAVDYSEGGTSVVLRSRPVPPAIA